MRFGSVKASNEGGLRSALGFAIVALRLRLRLPLPLPLAVLLMLGLGTLGATPGHAQTSGPARSQAVAADAAAAKTKFDAIAAELARDRRKVAALEQAYAKQTAEVERLKKQRASWRRDRELDKALAGSLEAAKTLEVAQRAAVATGRRLEAQRLVAQAAIARELPTAASTKLVTLKAWQAAITPPAPRRRIVLPDLSLDPYADPEDLLQQAAEIRQTEQALSREIAKLERQASRWEDIAALRETQQRSGELASAQTTDARRIAGTSRGNAEPATEPPPSGGPPPPAPQDDLPSPNPQEGFADDAGGVVSIAVALGGVLDGETRRALEASESSRDPRTRAKAATAAKRAATAKLETMRRQRALIEQRATQNR
ncbi:MAG: hypothetical protein IPL79_00910 [Myxococcales bacterium]|nr:hypothetical protein [Myxococcales bacterium]